MSANLVDSLLIENEHFNAAMGRLVKYFERIVSAKDPICMAIFGETRAGKSTVVEHFELCHPATRDKTGVVMPVLRIKVPSKPTVKSLIEHLLAKLGDPAFDKGTENIKVMRLLILLRRAHVRMVILDDFQHFIDKGTQKVLHHLADTLKWIIDEAGVAVVVVGLPNARAVLDQNEQLASRFAAPAMMPRFEWTDSNARREFEGILQHIQKMLAPYEFVDFSKPEMAFRFYWASGGLIGFVFKILREAIWYADEHDTKIVSLDDLGSAYETAVFKKADSTVLPNPFSTTIELSEDELTLQKIRQVGKPIDIPQKGSRG